MAKVAYGSALHETTGQHVISRLRRAAGRLPRAVAEYGEEPNTAPREAAARLAAAEASLVKA